MPSTQHVFDLADKALSRAFGDGPVRDVSYKTHTPLSTTVIHLAPSDLVLTFDGFLVYFLRRST